MAIEAPTVRHIARLASLDLTDDEVRVLSLQLNQILDHIEKLNELDLRSVEPTSHASGEGQTLREDSVVPSVPVSEALANAPETREGHFTVPRVIG
jgi:aspartyl-tRNA(Asn)/glutamyl-tRNA(Gln) amidotransferase subunit C